MAEESVNVQKSVTTEVSEYYSEYSSDEYDENGENIISERVKNMVKIENDVWDVYRYLQKEIENNGGTILKHLSLNSVYELMYPNYQPLF